MSKLKIKTGAVVSKQVVIAAAAVNAANELGLDVDIVITSGVMAGINGTRCTIAGGP